MNQPPLGKALMVLGTTSDAGKSFIATGLCRAFVKLGYRVAPFKVQNMALNAAVTADGGEMGMAQAVQAEACGIEPQTCMNPILLKPTGDHKSQVIVQGKVWQTLDAKDYYAVKQNLLPTVDACFNELRSTYDLVIVEGAGSPAEINLKAGDFVNAGFATRHQIPCLLVGDIHRGGVFASLYGTVALLTPQERQCILGFIINQFRGDRTILEPGEKELEALTGLPVLGCVPALPIQIEPEDSLSLARMASANQTPLHGVQAGAKDRIHVAVIRLPHVSNFSDFSPLLMDGRFDLHWVEDPKCLTQTHWLILPGSKNVIRDRQWLSEMGWDVVIQEQAKLGTYILGICGGYQLLGEMIDDTEGIESGHRLCVAGLGLLPIRTVYRSEKRCRQVSGYWQGVQVSGFELHQGESIPLNDLAKPMMTDLEYQGEIYQDGMCDSNGQVMGTYLHGLFEGIEARDHFYQMVRSEGSFEQMDQTQSPQAENHRISRETAYDRLAEAMDEYLPLSQIAQKIGLSR